MIADKFKLNRKKIIITGGGGFLGSKYAEAIIEADGIPILLDNDLARLQLIEEKIRRKYPQGDFLALDCDITSESKLKNCQDIILSKYESIDVLINNAAHNPQVSPDTMNDSFYRLETISLDTWNQHILVGLTGSFLCSRIFGSTMANRGSGIIINISSDLGVIAPDQRLYEKDGVEDNEQPVKPVTYSVVKTGLLGLTRYLATYWADKGVRTNAVAFGGVYLNQNNDFLEKVSSRIPLGRMAHEDEYAASIVYLCSDASSYMNGATIVIDGGRTIW